MARRRKSDIKPDEVDVWVRTASSVFNRCMKDGGSSGVCEITAIRQASGVVNSRRGNETMDQLFVFDDTGNSFRPEQKQKSDADSVIQFETFWKDVITEGRFKHPLTNQVLDVDEARMKKWVDVFNKGKALGKDVPQPFGHSLNSADNTGFYTEFRIVDGSDERKFLKVK